MSPKDWIQCTSVNNDCLGGCRTEAEHRRYNGGWSRRGEDLRRWLARAIAPDLWPGIAPRPALVWQAPPAAARDRRQLRVCQGCGARTWVLVERGRLAACPDCAMGLVSALLARSET